MPQDPAQTGATAPQPVIFITGASSGIGRALFNHYTDPCRPGPTPAVVGVDKEPWTDSAGVRHDVFRPRGAPGGSVYARLDITSPAEEQRALVRRWVGGATPVGLVVHCAGVRGLVPGVPVRRPEDVAAAEALGSMDAATLARTYEVNVVGAFSLLSAVLPGLELAAAAAAGRRPGDGGGPPGPRVVVLSSRMGSIGANDRGGGYAYRASKAALNAVLKSMSVDVPGVFFAMVHPGRVETGLVGLKEDGAISIEQCLGDLLSLLERFGPEGDLESGCFVDRFGERIPW